MATLGGPSSNHRRIGAERRVLGRPHRRDDGCNGYFGVLPVPTGVIEIGEMGSTAIGGDGPISATEQ